MTITRNHTRRKVPQAPIVIPLAVERSIGYLQGGYKDGGLWSKVQLFNTITQTGRIVYDTGYSRYYTPGLSGSNYGYFSSSATQYQKYSYITATSSSSFSISGNMATATTCDFGKYNECWMILGTTYPASSVDWQRVTTNNDTVQSYGNLSSTAYGYTRQAINTSLAAIYTDSNETNFIVMPFATRSITNVTGDSSVMNSTGAQYACGMAKDDSTAYFVGFSPYTEKINLTGTTINSVSRGTAFGYNFGESHSITSNTAGFMMAGYNDTTGRYGGSQHGLCQKYVFANASIVTLADLSLPQSSGQMMQGF